MKIIHLDPNSSRGVKTPNLVQPFVHTYTIGPTTDYEEWTNNSLSGTPRKLRQIWLEPIAKDLIRHREVFLKHLVESEPVENQNIQSWMSLPMVQTRMYYRDVLVPQARMVGLRRLLKEDLLPPGNGGEVLLYVVGETWRADEDNDHLSDLYRLMGIWADSAGAAQRFIDGVKSDDYHLLTGLYE